MNIKFHCTASYKTSFFKIGNSKERKQKTFTRSDTSRHSQPSLSSFHLYLMEFEIQSVSHFKDERVTCRITKEKEAISSSLATRSLFFACVAVLMSFLSSSKPYQTFSFVFGSCSCYVTFALQKVVWRRKIVLLHTHRTKET